MKWRRRKKNEVMSGDANGSISHVLLTRARVFSCVSLRIVGVSTLLRCWFAFSAHSDLLALRSLPPAFGKEADSLFKRSLGRFFVWISLVIGAESSVVKKGLNRTKKGTAWCPSCHIALLLGPLASFKLWEGRECDKDRTHGAPQHK